MNKRLFLIINLIFLGAGISFLRYDIRQAFPYVYNIANVNRQGVAIDSVWYNQSNQYHNDVLINTILSDKNCVYNSGSWYADYYEAFAKEASIREDIPDGKAVRAFDLQNFTDVGYVRAPVHATLVNHQAGEKDVSHLYVCTDGMAEAERVIAFNDEDGNIYLIAEDIWDEQNF